MFASRETTQMRTICLFTLIVALSVQSMAQKTSYKVGIIGFYNLENFYDTINDPKTHDEEFLPNGTKHYTSEVYLDKVGRLAEVLSKIGTDLSPDGLAIIGDAEIENETVLLDLVHHPLLKKRNYQIIHYDSPDERGVDVALLYNPKYFSKEFSESLFVPIFNQDGSPRKTRDILFVKGKLDGEEIFIMVGHWPSRRGGEEVSAPNRAIAAGVCRHKADSILAKNPDAKIVIMGDLNDDPVSPSVAKVIGAKGEKAKVGRSGFFNPWVEPYKQGIGTLAYNDSWNLFDQILVSGGFLNTEQSGFFYKEAHIFSKPWMIQTTGRYKGYPKRTYDFDNYMQGYSDHFPTYIVLLKKTSVAGK